jgi:aryl-alcohol dehydrogenase-like predicted oxidoreductase
LIVSEIGYGMWGMGCWTGSNDEESLRALQVAVDLGCNFFDTAYAYGEGRSESFLGQIVRANRDKQIYTATKVPPKNLKWPAQPSFTLDDCYPTDHIEEFLHKSLANAGPLSAELISKLREYRWVREPAPWSN